MTESPQSPSPESRQESPFASPRVAEMRPPATTVEALIDRESLSTGGRIAWLVIAAVVAFMIISTAVYRSGEESRTEASDSDLFPVQLEARAHIGQRNFFGGKFRPKDSDAEESAGDAEESARSTGCLLYTSPSPRDQRGSRMPSSA